MHYFEGVDEVCIFCILKTFLQQKKQSEAIGLICLSSLLVTIYIAWLVLTIRYHCLVRILYSHVFLYPSYLSGVVQVED